MVSGAKGLAALCLALGSAAVAQDEKRRAARGLVCRVVLDRSEAVVGEVLHLEVILENRTGGPVRVPSNGLAGFERIRLRCRTARGDVLRWVPHARATPRPAPRSGRHVLKIAEGQRATIAKISFRLSTNVLSWRPDGMDSARPTDLRTPGDYLFWVGYQAPQNKPALRGVWSGHVTSEPARLKLAAKRKRLRPLPEELEKDLKAFALRGDASVYGRVYRAVEQADEALVQRMIKLIGEDPQRFRRLWQLLAYHAGSRNFSQGLVPGCASPALAKLVRDAVRDEEIDGGRWVGRNGVHILSAHVVLHPDDRRVRGVFETMLRRSCKLDQAGPVHVGLAWQALIDLGVLRDGMTVEAARRILGKPTIRVPKAWIWRVRSPRHVNPTLSAQLRDGKLYGFRTGRG